MGSTQSRRIGHGAAHHAHHVGDADVARNKVDSERHHHVQRHNEHRDAVELDALVLERREEAGTHLQTYREDKQDEAELLDKLEGGGIHLHTEVTDQDATEQYKSGPQ